MFSLVLFAVSSLLAASSSTKAEQVEPIQGYPTAGVPILPEYLDFAEGLLDSEFVFDVLDLLPNQGTGGTVQARESPNTPALQGQGIALSLFTLEVRGQNLIHFHPRATELLYVIKGIIEVAFTDTNGVIHTNVVKAGQATVFPRALLHFQRNIGKVQSQYISMLNSENPGVMSFPRVFASLPSEVLSQALRMPEKQVEQLQKTVLPPTLLRGNTKYDNVAGPNGNAPVSTVKDIPNSSPKDPTISLKNNQHAVYGTENNNALYDKLKEYLKEEK